MISKCLTRVAVVWAEMLVSCADKIKQNEPFGDYNAGDSIPWEAITQTLKEHRKRAILLKEIDFVRKKNSDIS